MHLSQAFVIAVATWSLVPFQVADKTDEAAAIAKVQSLGGEIERLSEQPPRKNAPAGDPVVRVNLISSTKLKDEDLSCLRSFPELTHLYLGRTRISDAGLVHVAGLKHLTRLGLIGTKVTDAGLRNLGGLTDCRSYSWPIRPSPTPG